MDKITTHRINVCFLETLSQEDKKAFSIVLLIKNKFVSSYIKDYNVYKLANQLKTSRYSIQKYIGLIVSNGWGDLKDNGDIKIHSFSTIFKEYEEYKKSNKLIKVQNSFSIGRILDELNFLILQRNLEQQEWRAKAKRIHLGMKLYGFNTSKNEVRKDRELVKHNPERLDGELVGHGILGMRRLSEILKCSVNSAIAFLDRLKKRGLINTKHVKRVLLNNEKPNGKNGLTDYVSNSIGHFYRYKGRLYQFVGTAIELNYSEVPQLKVRYRNNVKSERIGSLHALFVQFPTLQVA